MEGQEEVTKEISVTMKRVTSFAAWFCYFGYGMAYNFLSPALVELKNKYETTIDEISQVFTIILLAYLAGALICGILFNYFNRQLIIVALLYLMAVGVFIMPFMPTKSWFFVNGGIIGFSAGGFDTSQVVWMLEMWHGEAGVYVQTQYFSFALGTLVAPLLLKPFLLEEDMGATPCSPPEVLSDLSSTLAPRNSTQESQLYIPLSMGGCIIVAGASFVLFLYFYDKYVPPSQATLEETKPGDRSVEDEKTSSTAKLFVKIKSFDWPKIVLVGLSALTLGFYQGMEVCTFQFLPTFAHYIKLCLPEPDGALLLSGLTGAYTVGRLGGILISYFKVSPALILIFNLIFATAGNVVLLLFANSNLTLLWVGAVLLGLGYSTVFACVYDHIEKHLVVTNLIAATMIIVGGLVSAIYPVIIGDSIEESPLILTYVLFFSLVTCTITFSIIYFITVIRKRGSDPPGGPNALIAPINFLLHN